MGRSKHEQKRTRHDAVKVSIWITTLLKVWKSHENDLYAYIARTHNSILLYIMLTDESQKKHLYLLKNKSCI